MHSRKLKQRPPVFIFAATDGSGSAGALADCRTLTKANCLPLTVITAVTAQNFNGVHAYWRLSPTQVRRQFFALSIAAAAFKIGVIGGAEKAIAMCLDAHPAAPVVWDPVFAATAGGEFINPQELTALRRYVLPRTFIVTPNRRELLALSGEKEPQAAMKKLLSGGATHVLVTDWHGRGKTVRHLLFAGKGETPLWEAACARRRHVYHGSGCFFSSTIAARLAHGDSPAQAAARAQAATLRALTKAEKAPALGHQLII